MKTRGGDTGTQHTDLQKRHWSLEMRRMLLISRHPTFLLLINRCKTIPQLQKLHAQTITTGLLSLYPCLLLTKILYTFTTTINTSSSHHHDDLLLLYYAVSVFNQIPNPSTFSYNTIIRAHTLLSSPLPALLLFSQMRFLSIPPDPHTFPFVLKACTHLRQLRLGQSLHSQAIRFGFGHDIFVTNTLIKLYSNLDSLLDAYQLFDESSQLRDVVSYNAMIDGFVKARDMTRARHIFDNMPIKDPVSWGTLLAGYAQTNQCEEAILLFDRMLLFGVMKPDNVALVSVLSACGHIGALEQGKTIHDYIQRNGIRIDVFLSTGLVDMYAKCGCIEMAIEVFESCPDKNLFTWNAMVVGLAMHGHGELSLQYFLRMRQVGVRPDGVSFLGVLVGCSHAGLVNDAMKLFDEMESVYGVKTELKHYGCMVDLLGRAGLIKEAMEVIERRMPMEGDAFVWGGLLGGCRIHGNVEVAEIAAEHMMEIHPEDGGGVYKIMADIYANAGRWEDVAKVRKLMNAGRFHKSAAASSLIT